MELSDAQLLAARDWLIKCLPWQNKTAEEIRNSSDQQIEWFVQQNYQGGIPAFRNQCNSECFYEQAEIQVRMGKRPRRYCTPIEFRRNNIPVVEVVLGDRHTAFLIVDTGCSTVALTREQIGGVRKRQVGFTDVQTANGLVRCKRFELESISVGCLTVWNVEVNLLPEGNDGFGLLGHSFWGDRTVAIHEHTIEIIERLSGAATPSVATAARADSPGVGAGDDLDHLRQAIAQISKRPYRVVRNSGWGNGSLYNLDEDGLKGVHLVSSTFDEVLDFVREQEKATNNPTYNNGTRPPTELEKLRYQVRQKSQQWARVNGQNESTQRWVVDWTGNGASGKFTVTRVGASIPMLTDATAEEVLTAIDQAETQELSRETLLDSMIDGLKKISPDFSGEVDWTPEEGYHVRLFTSGGGTRSFKGTYEQVVNNVREFYGTMAIYNGKGVGKRETVNGSNSTNQTENNGRNPSDDRTHRRLKATEKRRRERESATPPRYQPPDQSRPVELFGKLAFWVGTICQIIWMSFKPPYNTIYLGAGFLYCLGLAIENYVTAVPSMATFKFMPKPGIDDGANLVMLGALLFNPNALVMAFVAFSVQAVEIASLNTMTMSEKQIRYKEAEKFETPNPKPGATYMAKHYAKAIANHGWGRHIKILAFTALFWAIDAVAAHNQYPWLDQVGGAAFMGTPAANSTMLHFLWFCASVAGAEAFGVWMGRSYPGFRITLPHLFRKSGVKAPTLD